MVPTLIGVCEVHVLTRGNVSATWQDNATCDNCHCTDFNLIPICIWLFQFSPHFCAFGSILSQFFLIIEEDFLSHFFIRLKVIKYKYFYNIKY